MASGRSSLEQRFHLCDFAVLLQLPFSLSLSLFLAAVGLLCVSSGVTMSVPFALGRIIDLIYKIDQTKSEEEQKKKIEENLKK